MFEESEAALSALRARRPTCWSPISACRAAAASSSWKRSAPSGRLPVIVMTAHSDLDSAVAAYQGGAFEYLPKPFDIDQAIELVRRAASPGQRVDPTASESRRIPEMLGHAPAMQEVFRAIGRLSRSSMTVLITGESGTGKACRARSAPSQPARG